MPSFLIQKYCLDIQINTAQQRVVTARNKWKERRGLRTCSVDPCALQDALLWHQSHLLARALCEKHLSTCFSFDTSQICTNVSNEMMMPVPSPGMSESSSKPSEISSSVLQTLRQNRISPRKCKDQSQMRQGSIRSPAMKGYETWWILRHRIQSEKLNQKKKTGTLGWPSQKESSGFFPMWKSKTVHLPVRFCAPLSVHKCDLQGLARQDGVLYWMQALATREQTAAHRLSFVTWRWSQQDRPCTLQGRVALRRGRRLLATDRADTGGESITARIRPHAKTQTCIGCTRRHSGIGCGQNNTYNECLCLKQPFQLIAVEGATASPRPSLKHQNLWPLADALRPKGGSGKGQG